MDRYRISPGEKYSEETVQTPLLKCPHCGGDPLPTKELRGGCKDGEPDAWAYYISCRSCAATGGWGKSPGSAERLWNMRQPS